MNDFFKDNGKLVVQSIQFLLLMIVLVILGFVFYKPAIERIQETKQSVEFQSYVNCVDQGNFTVLNIQSKNDVLTVYVNYNFTDIEDYTKSWKMFTACSSQVNGWKKLVLEYIYFYPVRAIDDDQLHVGGRLTFGLVIPRKNILILSNDNAQDVKDGKIEFFNTDYIDDDYDMKNPNGDNQLAIKRYLEYMQKITKNPTY